jgi:hypothetical protein
VAETRRVLIRGDGVALAELVDGDRERFDADSDGAFDVDPDDRPRPAVKGLHRVAVTTVDGVEVLGVAMWHQVEYGPTYGCMAWNFGAELLPATRGKGLGAEVWRLVIRHLFATTDVDRVEASTDVTNFPARRSLEKAGMIREGVIRGAQVRAGKRQDLVAYGLLRTDVTDEKLTAGQNAATELASGDG